jgi:ubiquinone/menaquinone biosynthesis C-methylase UbiE
VDHLLAQGFRKISVLDISATALEKAKTRLGESSKFVNFIVSDITKFDPPEKYKLWHDRATFHFLTSVEDITSYLDIASRGISPGGYLIVSTFSKTGPEKCSGLPISRYSDADLKALFGINFVNVRCFEDTHSTPWGIGQNFVYCGFKKR